jgi:hypothetical protein
MQYSLYVANYDEMVRDDNKSCANGHCVMQGQGEISIHARWSPLSIGIGVIWLQPRSHVAILRTLIISPREVAWQRAHVTRFLLIHCMLAWLEGCP